MSILSGILNLLKSKPAAVPAVPPPAPVVAEIPGDNRAPLEPAGVEPKPSEATALSDPKEMPQCGIDLIKQFEGCRLESYRDIVGVWTIGYGSTGKDIGEGLKWNEAQAEARLKEDCHKFLAAIEKEVHVPLSVVQRGALLCFTYNLGPGNLKMLVENSGLNLGKYLQCADRILRYDKAGGKQVAGLTRRRVAERDLFLRVDSTETKKG